MHSLTQLLYSGYPLGPGAALGTGDIAVNITDKSLLIFQWEGDIKQVTNEKSLQCQVVPSAGMKNKTGERNSH